MLTSAEELRLLWLLHGEKINTRITAAVRACVCACVSQVEDVLLGRLKFLLRFHEEVYEFY